MKVCVIGTGYVGLVAGACFSYSGNTVYCVDIDEEKIDNIKHGIIPIYEPGLKEIVVKNVSNGRLIPTTSIQSGVQNSDIIFIAVGTPEDEDGSADLKHVISVAESIAENMNGYKIVVNKSTVPVGTAEIVKTVIQEKTDIHFDIISNPEFLKEGAAVEDFLKPDRVIVGGESQDALNKMVDLYSPFVRKRDRIITMDNKSAELTKYAANSMLATRISFMNDMAALAEKAGADIEMIRRGIGSDSRIGLSFLYPGTGYGGSCFPKDVKAILKTASDIGQKLDVIDAVERVNDRQKGILAEKILTYFNNDIKGKCIAVWGLAFKPNTDDMREAPAIILINKLLEQGAIVRAFDPVAMEKAKIILNNSRIEFVEKQEDALKNSDALAIVTEWMDFRKPDFQKIKELLKAPIIFDGRNIYNPDRMLENGYDYISIGRRSVMGYSDSLKKLQ